MEIFETNEMDKKLIEMGEVLKENLKPLCRLMKNI